MTIDELNQRLEAAGLVVVSAAEWARLATELVEVERHPTYIAGDLIIVRGPGGLAAVEQPGPQERVVRHLRDLDEVRRFVARRLEQYERMWDGCGCKVDYHATEY